MTEDLIPAKYGDIIFAPRDNRRIYYKIKI